EVQRQSLPPESQSVRQSLELTERVVVIPHAARDLIGVLELDAAVQLIERIRDERLVEIACGEEPEALLLVRLPREADLQVARERAPLVLVDERDAGSQVLDVHAEVEARRRDAIERGQVQAERGADTRERLRRQLDADVLERSTH